MPSKSFYWNLSFMFITAVSSQYEELPLPVKSNFSSKASVEILLKNYTSKYKYSHGSHIYYNSSLIDDNSVFNHYWVDLKNHSDSNIHEMLSESHRKAATIRLKFQFPFYGHLINAVTLTTGGFLYVGDYKMEVNQYIAPLMANFDLSESDDSIIYYMDNGTALTVTWCNITLQDESEVGQFTFQTTLYLNGNIVFAYKQLPINIEDIHSTNGPVVIGLSDAFIAKSINHSGRETGYTYHRILFPNGEITVGTVIILTASPTCMEKKNCISCTKKDTNFQCYWCDNRCFSGIDRNREDWMKNDCDKFKIDEDRMCTTNLTTDVTTGVTTYNTTGVAIDNTTVVKNGVITEVTNGVNTGVTNFTSSNFQNSYVIPSNDINFINKCGMLAIGTKRPLHPHRPSSASTRSVSTRCQFVLDTDVPRHGSSGQVIA